MHIPDEITSAARLLSQGNASEAGEVVLRVLAVDRHQEAAWVILFDSWMSRHAVGKAAEAALNALAAVPSSTRLLARLMLARLHQGNFAEAAARAEDLWGLKPKNLEALTMLGQVAVAVERHELAKAAFERADVIRPGDPQLKFNLATSLRNFGEFERAEKLYDQVIQLRPDDWEAFKNRSELRRQTPDRNHIEELNGALRQTRADWQGSIMVHYALGKEYEDLGNAERAFDAYDAGAKLRRRNMEYRVEADLQRILQIQKTFTADWIQSRARGSGSSAPIFVFGLPRAGSTLLERMLGAHSQVFAAGELQDFGIAVMEQVNRSKSASAASDLIARSSELDPLQLGDAYLARTAERTGACPFFTDKLPGNFLYAGLIAAALPNAKMIHIYRDPRDAGFAMYKTLFKQAYPFSYDLSELGQYINAYQGLMDHWHQALPGRIFDVSYERLVSEPEAVLEGVCGYAGLVPEPGCLDYHLSAGPSSTASAVQVRRPIYSSSVEAWRKYERQLKPLIEALSA